MKVLEIILVLVSLLSGGCSSNTSKNIVATVLISPSQGQEITLFEIYDDKSMWIKVAEVEENIKLSAKDKETIEELLLKISAKDEDQIKSYFNDVIEVTAKINGKIYWTPFYDGVYANKDLLDLTYKLIELSPIDVGGEQNPITVPK